MGHMGLRVSEIFLFCLMSLEEMFAPKLLSYILVRPCKGLLCFLLQGGEVSVDLECGREGLCECRANPSLLHAMGQGLHCSSTCQM